MLLLQGGAHLASRAARPAVRPPQHGVARACWPLLLINLALMTLQQRMLVLRTGPHRERRAELWPQECRRQSGAWRRAAAAALARQSVIRGTLLSGIGASQHSIQLRQRKVQRQACGVPPHCLDVQRGEVYPSVCMSRHRCRRMPGCAASTRCRRSLSPGGRLDVVTRSLLASRGGPQVLWSKRCARCRTASIKQASIASAAAVSTCHR